MNRPSTEEKAETEEAQVKITHIIALSGLLLSASMAALATPITLNMTGLQNLEPIGNYFNGGTGGDGSGPGPNYGIVFGPDSLAIISRLDGGTGNFQNNPSGGPIAFFLGGPGDVMDVAAGFDTGFSFYYSANFPGSVDVYSGLDGTGTLLQSLSLSAQASANCAPDSTTTYCNWTEQGVSFAGTAESVVFSGSANYIGFDEITLGSATVPGAMTPEPGSFFLLGTGLLGLGLLLMRKKQASVGMVTG